MHPGYAVPNWFDFQVLSSHAGLSSSRSNEPLPNALFDMIRLLMANTKSRIPVWPLLLASLDWIVVCEASSINKMPVKSLWKDLVARMVLPVEAATSIPTPDSVTSLLALRDMPAEPWL